MSDQLVKSSSPSKSEFIRSALPYFSRRRPKLAGSVQSAETSSGQKYVVYLPPGYEVGHESYAVLYHFHGAGAFWQWVEKDINWIADAHEESVRSHSTEPLIIVGAYDPSKFSLWTDSADGANTVSSAVIKDLIPHIESSFRAKTQRRSRFIQGFSMGGFGAATTAFKFQDLFAAVIIWDGALHDWATLNASRPKIAATQFGDAEAHFEDWSPWVLAGQADLARTPVMIVSGLLVDFADRYARHLADLGGEVTRFSEDCMHDLRCLQRKRGVDAFQFLAASS